MAFDDGYYNSGKPPKKMPVFWETVWFWVPNLLEMFTYETHDTTLFAANPTKTEKHSKLSVDETSGHLILHLLYGP